jgi:hypothetical protein
VDAGLDGEVGDGEIESRNKNCTKISKKSLETFNQAGKANDCKNKHDELPVMLKAQKISYKFCASESQRTVSWWRLERDILIGVLLFHRNLRDYETHALLMAHYYLYICSTMDTIEDR